VLERAMQHYKRLTAQFEAWRLFLEVQNATAALKTHPWARVQKAEAN